MQTVQQRMPDLSPSGPSIGLSESILISQSYGAVASRMEIKIADILNLKIKNSYHFVY